MAPSTISIVSLCVLLVSSDAIQLKVGIYNYLPDLADDGLTSYKTMIQDGFPADHGTVDAVVEKDLYNPYGDLEKYLKKDGFDMLEIDTNSLQDLVDKDLIVPFQNIAENIFPAAVQAVMINGGLYAYPTLLCGNFLIALSPSTAAECDLKSARTDYTSFYDTFSACSRSLLEDYPQYQRVFGGKMNNAAGNYLPDLYIDGYIDVHGADTARQAVEQLVVSGVVDPTVCERLKWYIAMCGNKDNNGQTNKCYQNFPGSYVQSSGEIYPDITNEKTMFYFGFSENLATVLNDNPGMQAYAAISAPMGPTNRFLQYTDALVVSKKAWDEASEEKKNAMKSFVTYFTSTQLRMDITLGVDVGHQLRYLLQANQEVYSNDFIAQNVIYNDLFVSLNSGVALPYKTPAEMLTMEEVLSEQCLPDVVPPVFKGDPKNHRFARKIINLRKAPPSPSKQTTHGKTKKEL